MKKEYEVFCNSTGSPNSSGVRVRVSAESEHEAMQLAIKRAGGSNNKVATIKEIKR